MGLKSSLSRARFWDEEEDDGVTADVIVALTCGSHLSVRQREKNLTGRAAAAGWAPTGLQGSSRAGREKR